jgi:hypothetical protein
MDGIFIFIGQKHLLVTFTPTPLVYYNIVPDSQQQTIINGTFILKIFVQPIPDIHSPVDQGVVIFNQQQWSRDASSNRRRL